MLSAEFIANLWRSLSDAEHTQKKIGAIIIYLDILFTRDHFPAWLGTGVREIEGRRNERKGAREGGPQGFGDSWRETGREKYGRQERQCDEGV